MNTFKIQDEKYFVDGAKKQDIVSLSRLISLIESKKLTHNQIAIKVLKKIKSTRKSYVLGFSGTPGAGKSTVINFLGINFLKKYKKLKLAVLPIDPSSEITGGSILGDKTRMGELSENKRVFIRPVASKGSLGGVTPKIDLMIESLRLWGYDIIFVETVGVGQSEAKVRSYVHDLVLVVPPATGDDLQGMKRGLLEIIDAVFINKVDLFSDEQVQSSLRHYKSSLSILQKRDIPIYTCSMTTQVQNNEKIIHWLLDKFSNFQTKKIKSSSDTLEFDKKIAEELLINNFNDWLLKVIKKEKIKKLGSADLVNKYLKSVKLDQKN